MAQANLQKIPSWKVFSFENTSYGSIMIGWKLLTFPNMEKLEP